MLHQKTSVSLLDLSSMVCFFRLQQQACTVILAFEQVTLRPKHVPACYPLLVMLCDGDAVQVDNTRTRMLRSIELSWAVQALSGEKCMPLC